MTHRLSHLSLAVLRPAGDQIRLHANRIVFATGLDGFIRRGGEQGLYAHETRMLSEYRYLAGNREPKPVGFSAVTTRESVGYYVFFPLDRKSGIPDHGSGLLLEGTQQTVELFIRRRVIAGAEADDHLEERLRVTNYSDAPTQFVLKLIVDADFLGLPEVRYGSRGLGRLNHSWEEAAGELRFDWQASHHPSGSEKATGLRRSIAATVVHANAFHGHERGIDFPISLPPGGIWNAELRLTPAVDGVATARQPRPPRQASSFRARGDRSRATLVSGALARARCDLESLRLFDLDRGGRAWTMAAGVPMYVALFGRDVLTSAWQAAMMTPDMMRGSLQVLASLQGRRYDDWRDEAPGRLLHESHTGPLESLGLNPRARYYGSVTTSGFFPFVLAELWHWTGDEDFVRSLLPNAFDALRWLDEDGDIDRDGFVEYLTRSDDGVKHQGWKDSGDAIVYPDGSPVEPPIATCEEQAFVYVAKLHFAALLWRLRERTQARELFKQARELKRRFNEAFWMPAEGFLAMALDSTKRQVASIGSNAGHCLASGIVERTHARAIADRLMAPDLFSGWGIRTLSDRHPAFNPYSYHRGSVWPVEQGSFALGFVRHGLLSHAHRLARAIFDATAMFEHGRLPELYAGHQRDRDHPFPGLYPQANAPQAWSASTIFMLVQSLLGLYPYAPKKLLFVDPRLPRWLPDLTLRDLSVGSATVSLRFMRKPNGWSDYRVLDKQGELHILRQASPWSLTEPVSRRIRTLVASALPRHEM